MKVLRMCALFIAAAFIFSAGAAQARTWTVAKAPKKADFMTISEAVAAAKSGDRIDVAAGLYMESIKICKSITLMGAGGDEPDGDTDDSNALGALPDPSKQTVVKPASAVLAAFGLYADNIKVAGFAFVDSGANTAGVFTSPLNSGYEVTHNVFTRNSIALYLHSNGAQTTKVTDNVFFKNDDAFLAGGAKGIFSDMGLANAEINHNLFAGHPNAAIHIAPVAGLSRNISIDHNTSDHDTNFADIERCQFVSVDHNQAANSAKSLIFVGNGSSFITVSHNKLHNGARGIRVGANGGAISHHLAISHNDISTESEAGITVDDASVSNSSFDHNKCNSNNIGLRLFPGNAGNVIVDNNLENNTTTDAVDLTVGGGTAGTANFWEGNRCSTDNKGGALCNK